MCDERIDGHADVFVNGFECARRSGAVPHAGVVESQYTISGATQLARQQHELPVTARAILRAANYDQNTHLVRCRCGLVQDADELLFAASEDDGRFARHDKASAVAATIAGCVTISVVDQNGSPMKVAPLTVRPAARERSMSCCDGNGRVAAASRTISCQ